MEAWALHMLGTSVLKLGRSEEAAGIMRHALADFQRSGDLAGVTLVLDDLSAVAVVDGDLPRAARLRGAARQLQAATGTELATWVDEEFETATRPNARNSMAAEELERFGAEGAVMPLDEAIAYALEGHADGDAAHDAAMAASRPARTTPGSDAG